MREVNYAATCSMRTFPFFRKPGYFDNSYVLDGGFSGWFAIPDDCYFSARQVLRGTKYLEKLPQSSVDEDTVEKEIPEIDKVVRVSVVWTPDSDVSPPEEFAWPWKDMCSSGTLEDNLA